jgi:hypothetical protein
MGFLDSAKAAAEQAVTKAKETAGELQTKRELGQAYGELGRTTFDLVESGQVSATPLEPLVERIRTLKAHLEEGGADGAGASEEPANRRTHRLRSRSLAAFSGFPDRVILWFLPQRGEARRARRLVSA